MVKKERKSNFELLRIVSMVLIVSHHFSVHGTFQDWGTRLTFNQLWIQFLEMGGKIGVNIFIFISGYFLIDVDNINARKVLKLIGQTTFYSVIIYVVFVMGGEIGWSLKEFIRSFFPITLQRWWFASTYFVLYLFSSFLNIGIKCMKKKDVEKSLFLMLIMWCLIPSFTGNTFQSNELLWFVFVYMLAGYIKIHMKHCYTWYFYLIIAGVSALVTFMFVVILDILLLNGTRVPIVGINATYFYGLQMFPTLLTSMMLFLAFKEMDIPYSKKINKIASSCFGIYLIHDHIYVRHYLWEDLFQNKSFQNEKYLWLYSIFSISSVFVFCSIVELIRRNTIGKLWDNIVDKLLEHLHGKDVNRID